MVHLKSFWKDQVLGIMGIAENLSIINKKIARAALVAGRTPEEIQLVAVSKTKPLSLIQEAFAAGQGHFGENRVQELREKQPQMPEAHWHMIGSLQRNNVKYIAPFVHLIHSVDSEKLLREIDKRAGQHGRVIDCLLQINISDESQKSGLQEADARSLLEQIEDFPGVRIMGLMGMAEFTADMDVVRSQFQRLKQAFETFRAITHERVEMKELSMGMSGDFEVAIEEGATLVRIGSAVFGRR